MTANAKQQRPNFIKLERAIGQFANNVLHDGGEAPTVALGPLVWGIDAGHDTKHWYFVVASADTAGDFRSDQLRIGNDDRGFAEEARAALMTALISRRPVVVHDFDDELEMIRFCEALWPCAKTRRLRAALEQERAV